MRNKKALFEFIWDEIIYGVGGDGEGYIFLKDTPAETLAKEFYKWVDSEKVFRVLPFQKGMVIIMFGSVKKALFLQIAGIPKMPILMLTLY